MIFSYGSFESETAECLPEAFTQRRIYNARGRAQLLQKTLTVRFDIVKTSQATVHTRLQQLESAFALEGGSAVFRLDTGADSIYNLPAAGSHGVRIIDNTLWTEDGKAHYATGHPARITFQAEYAVSDGDPLVSYREQVTVIGNGGPRTVWLELDAGAPIQQTVSLSTPVLVIQSGEAVGSAAYPTGFIAAPLYPANLDNPDVAVTAGTPRWDGLSEVDYPISWQYRMTLPANPGLIFPVNR